MPGPRKLRYGALTLSQVNRTAVVYPIAQCACVSVIGPKTAGPTVGVQYLEVLSLKSLKCLQRYNSPKMHKPDDSCRRRDAHLPFTAAIPQTSLTYSHATNCDFGRKANMAGDHCRQLPTTARSDLLFFIFCFFSLQAAFGYLWDVAVSKILYRF